MGDDQPSALRRTHLARVDHRDPHRPTTVSPRIEQLAWWLDEAFRIPGTKARVGVDGVVGIVPVIGDLAGMAAGMVVVVAAALADVGIPTLIRMMVNVGVAGVVGMVPFAGDLFDFAFKANTRNIALIHRDLADHERTSRRSGIWLVVVVALIVAVPVAAVVAVALLTVYLLTR